MAHCSHCSGSCGCSQHDTPISTCELWRTGTGSWQGIRMFLRKPFAQPGCLWAEANRFPTYQLTFVNARPNPYFHQWCQAITHLTINNIPYYWNNMIDQQLTGFSLKDDHETFLIAPLAFTNEANRIIFHAAGYDDLDLLLAERFAGTSLTALEPPTVARANFDRSGTRCWLTFAEQRNVLHPWLQQINDIHANNGCCYHKSSRTLPLKSHWYDFDHWGNLIVSLDERFDLSPTLQINAVGYKPLLYTVNAS